MAPLLPVVAQPGSATVSSVRREEGQAANIRRKQYASARREIRRAASATQHKVFSGHTHDPRDAESILKPEIAWCERNCAGLWTIIYGTYQHQRGYTIHFGFTHAKDAKTFADYRVRRRHYQYTKFPSDTSR